MSRDDGGKAILAPKSGAVGSGADREMIKMRLFLKTGCSILSGKVA